mgnify:CR=1 FL=1
MTVKEVFELRREGRVEEAYRAILPMYRVHHGKYTTLAMFWCAADMMNLLLSRAVDSTEISIAALKDAGKKATGVDISVIETFDPGPEFAKSDFKYKYHNEICSGTVLDGEFGFIDATALLNADTREYAAYPHGIPQDTPFGTFLGKQSEVFLADMGFDYLWLSNGVGFSANPWKRTGVIFDGENYYPEKL